MKDLALADRAPKVSAVEYIRPLQGGSRPILCRASDGHCYVVKFLNNRQGSRCVVNELFASLLARNLGLPVPEPALVTITTAFVKRSRLSSEQTKAIGDCKLHLGSRIPVDPNKLAIYDCWPKQLNGLISNASEAVGCWLFDAWTSNSDGFQYVVHRQPNGSYRFWKIDHGFCFLAHHWSFHDAKLFPRGWVNVTMQCVATMTDFEPYLSRIKALSFPRLKQIAAAVPKAWLGGDADEFKRLLFVLNVRKAFLEELVTERWPARKIGDFRVAKRPATSGVPGPSDLRGMHPALEDWSGTPYKRYGIFISSPTQAE